MFWSILLAHLLADYPLQTDRLVIAKQQLPGLTLHAGIHLLMIVILTLPVIGTVWPYLLTITVLHFIIDFCKTLFGRRRPDWVIGPYIVDQILHISILIIVAYWIQQTTDLVIWQAFSLWWVLAIGMLMITLIWTITERVISYRDSELQTKVQRSKWLRMGVRVLIFLFVVLSLPSTWVFALTTILIMAYFYRRWL